ncbi:MAG TPA: sigma-70 family RNA polymerase sigma factor [Chthoniobacteraceae bacterium]|jgi:RNA polymerase sigma-70 factor (ECF subfamily)|nr:sigma-70 family RNA polymerase sigma factor [Chthoniobacteraceae bacterium]
MPLPLARLYDAHADALFGFLLNLTREEADSRDALQEVFVKLARRPELLDGVRDERGFLLRLAHHAALDLFRRKETRTRHETRFAAEAPLFEAGGPGDESAFREAVSTALAEVPEEQRAVVHLKLWEGLTFEAIAEVLGLSPNTAASRYRYALDKLRDRLRPLYRELQ